MDKLIAIVLIILITSACKNKGKKMEEFKEENISKDSKTWWKEGVLYQIYPQSFKDSDGDGFGDFRGVIEKLDYLESLGITMVWMNPFFESPLVDNGYDVSNYKAVHSRYGTMDDFKEMIEKMQARGIKFVLDIVVNHSSNEHEWFKQASSSRDNKYYNYYHWWPAEKGKPPHRHSIFDPEGGWHFNKATNSYYLHTFAQAQPDLNWENPKLRQEVYDIMKFWAEKGVDGFRLDAFQFSSKDTTYPEFPEGYEKDFIKWHGMRPQLHTYLKEMYKEVIEPYNIFAVAEGAGSTLQDAHDLVDEDRKELQTAYHFEYVDMSRTTAGYKLTDFKTVFTKWDTSFAEKGWLAIFLSNHDNSRLVNRFGNPSTAYRRVSTQMLNTFLLSMRGTPYTYYGDELGMTNIDMPRIEEYVDVSAIGEYGMAKARGDNMEEFMKQLNYNSRENGRTPMQWDDSENAGFTTGTPWKRVNDNYKEINVANQEKSPNSVLNHFRKMVKLRKENEVLVYGDYQLLDAENDETYCFTRTLDDVKVLVLLNFTDHDSSIELSEISNNKEILINNYDVLTILEKQVTLKAYQAVLLSIK
ncbi:alpha-glucosidase [Tenacibaculum tangerinum]|uniref:Alpha-glucosidase n=1 Tax=Tenacibaculum tangerinum TaxID=3038772 RepID=A0ABY8L7L4_9FLAO|nr:alpha-glucosidase [Tenacibaculum tangerinum]WGH76094.1 alpha-glucosidase [Tenacibaculum tangerinum]